MNDEQTQVPPPSTFGVDDILYLFFRHKWKIIFCTLVGCALGAWFYLGEREDYRVQAKLLIRYINEKRDPRDGTPGEKDTVRQLDPRDGATMLAEAEILRSIDCIKNAITTVTPQRVLNGYGKGTNLYDAVELVLKNLNVEPTKNSGLMVVTLTHRDQEVAQRLLSEILLEYQELHQRTHKPSVTYAQISKEKDNVQGKLQAVEDLLRTEKRKVNIWSLDQSKADITSQMTALKTQIAATEAELASLRAVADERKGSKGTNEVAEAGTAKPEAPSSADTAKYVELFRKLAQLRRNEVELRDIFSESSKKVQQLRADIKQVEEEMEKIPIDPAYIAQLNGTAAGQPAESTYDWQKLRMNIVAGEARYQILTNKFAKLTEQAARLDSAEDTIVDLENQKKKLEEQYAYYRKELDQLNLDNTIDLSRGNINVVQNATRIPPDSKKLIKKAGGAVMGGVVSGFALAFLLDFMFNTSVKRRKDLEVGAKLPVLVTIPELNGKHSKGALTNGKTTALQKTGRANGHVAAWEEGDPMLPYYEALRDRVVMSYNGDLHKPKIVGLTSCNGGAGVSRLATGLAAALSRDAERNILLVGLERNKVAVSAFAKGRPTEGIEPPPEVPNSEQQLVAQNLYSLATTGRNLAGASVVQSFSDLMPKLKISDYDYIIFDLPPLSQTSGSLRLASQMERTILVVEAEETTKDKVKRARKLLTESHANLFAVLNKSHSYGPKSLDPDI